MLDELGAGGGHGKNNPAGVGDLVRPEEAGGIAETGVGPGKPLPERGGASGAIWLGRLGGGARRQVLGLRAKSDEYDVAVLDRHRIGNAMLLDLEPVDGQTAGGSEAEVRDEGFGPDRDRAGA